MRPSEPSSHAVFVALLVVLVEDGTKIRTTITWTPTLKTRLPLAYQILVFQCAIILLSTLIGTAGVVWYERQQLDNEYEQRALVIAESVASNDDVVESLQVKDPDHHIQRLAESVRIATNALYVVVTDRNGIRYSHPNPAQIGQPVGTPIPPDVLAGHTWVGIQMGSLGNSARGKAPIMRNGEVIGEVSVGYSETTINQQLLGQLPTFALTVLLSLVLGVAASILLARWLKRQTFDLEPYEITGLLEEREASLQGIHEGAIATASDGTITLANDEARRLLGLPTDCVGRKLSQVLPADRLLKFLSGGLKDEDEVLLSRDRVLVASRRGISVRGQEIGHVATLRDTTELTGLAQGLGVEGLTDALRAQAHEFANRLHTIAGLVQIASERGIELRVSDDTVIARSALDSEDLITVLGNLIDNAFDAASTSAADRWVSVSVTDKGGEVVMKVQDSGPGVPDGVDGLIFQEGFSTKNGAGRKRRGFGLALVSQIVRRTGGTVSVVNDRGALFTVRIPVKADVKL
ncbi:MAG: sensor histidine kinase [Chloroflexi bacterium]|nr:MAG: sensor histidine kinase [Chloroflexota bacterium]